MYKLARGNLIIRESDGAFIPKDLGNADYVEFLEYVEAGFPVEPADPIVIPAVIPSAGEVALQEIAALKLRIKSVEDKQKI